MAHPRWMTFSAALLRGCLLFLPVAAAFTVALPSRITAQERSQPPDDALRRSHSVTVYAGLNEDAQIFLFPQSPDPVLRQRTEPLGTAWGYALSWRYRMLPTLSTDLRCEYITVSKVTGDAVGTPIRHGAEVTLLEASALFALPFSSRRFESYVGGGLGLHIARRQYAIAGVEAEHVSSDPAIGLHVTVGVEYIIAAGFGLRFEAVFRDPLVGVENRFPRASVSSRGIEYPLQTEPFRSNVNLNGNVYSLGIFYSL